MPVKLVTAVHVCISTDVVTHILKQNDSADRGNGWNLGSEEKPQGRPKCASSKKLRAKPPLTGVFRELYRVRNWVKFLRFICLSRSHVCVSNSEMRMGYFTMEARRSSKGFKQIETKQSASGREDLKQRGDFVNEQQVHYGTNHLPQPYTHTFTHRCIPPPGLFFSYKQYMKYATNALSFFTCIYLWYLAHLRPAGPAAPVVGKRWRSGVPVGFRVLSSHFMGRRMDLVGPEKLAVAVEPRQVTQSGLLSGPLLRSSHPQKARLSNCNNNNCGNIKIILCFFLSSTKHFTKIKFSKFFLWQTHPWHR